ncbi:MAG: type VII secretion protein EccCb, partial [Ktedonobacteraceae bacterium]|nr:type VII secretion protein EccCb [Ktedonobacteraceae bacterium]
VVEAIRPSTMWKQRPRESVLRTPIGKLEKGKTLLLDLKEAAEKGEGPHGLVVGATGSGKSELLRTLVISQAMLHDPRMVNFVFVDFKGGASFADLATLPHVAGMVTNLENEPALIDRMHSSLTGELRRRQRMLREAGNLDNVQQYQIKWQTNPDNMEPMPHLLIIVDEFAELLTNRPDFLDLFITIGRVGRSLGLHLLLATQRLEEGRLKGLESYLRYRICLRTFSAAESSAVLGKPDAYYLPSSPGVGYLKIDANMPLRFKTALVSVPYVPTTHQLVAADMIREFAPNGRLMPCSTMMPGISTAQADANLTEMDIVIARLAEPATPGNRISVHQVWLPPLPKSLKLGALFGRNFDGTPRYAAPQFGPLRVPVGLLDVPLEQVQVPLLLDFSGAGGHLALTGAPQTGKSTFLRTLMTSFVVTHSPRDVQLYCIDMGGGQLRPFEGFPHVGAVCTKTDREKILLLIRLMYKVIADREVLFRDSNIESMATFRARRQTGDFSDFPFGDVFLLIDNLAQLLHDFEQIEADLVNLVATGLTYGVHIVVASNRWAEVRAKIRDNIGTRLELRLNDPSDSEVDKKKSAELPIGVPGRGLIKDKLQFQICLPWVDTARANRGTDDISQQQALDALIEQTSMGRGPAASPVLMLPTRVSRQEILSARAPGHAGVPIGLEEFRLDPIYIDLLSAEPHFLVLGDAECGKTNLLRLWWSELTRRYTPEQVQVAAIECRATTNLLEITQSKHFLTYGSMRMPSSVKESVECLTNTLKERTLPATYSSIQDLISTKAWTGPHYFLFVDDYDAVASPSGSPLTPVRDLIVQARDVGFHVILTRTVSGLTSSSYEAILKSLRESGSPGLIMSGSRQEGRILYDQAATNLPPGRGYLVQRKYPPTLVQVALA